MVKLFKEQRDIVNDVLSGKKDLEKDAKKAINVPLTKAEVKKFAEYTRSR